MENRNSLCFDNENLNAMPPQKCMHELREIGMENWRHRPNDQWKSIFRLATVPSLEWTIQISHMKINQ